MLKDLRLISSDYTTSKGVKHNVSQAPENAEAAQPCVTMRSVCFSAQQSTQKSAQLPHRQFDYVFANLNTVFSPPAKAVPSLWFSHS